MLSEIELSDLFNALNHVATYVVDGKSENRQEKLSSRVLGTYWLRTK
jgi:hypothetical protein